jgi:putative colanic acid biosysnthesis UDP-glucose lipid carrier transferase
MKIEAMDDSAKAYRMTAQEYAVPTVAGEVSLGSGIPQPDAGSRPSFRASEAARVGRYGQVKRMHDVVFSFCFLLVGGLWMFPIIAMLIKLDSPGPVLFRQERVGWRGRRFVCLKFRTMTHNPDAGFVQAQKNDPRVTRVGKFLRKTNLDELPQFLNVLKGDMSVVGPRPHVQQLDALHSDQVPGYVLRHAVRPGVTGLAQVSGCRGETRSIRDMERRIRFDLFYLRNMSFMLDVKIILLTVVRVVQGDSKAY